MTSSLLSGNRHRITRLSALTLALASALASHVSLAQERWFQVEVVAFSRSAPDQQEQWPTNIKLGYPLNLIELKDPNAPATPTPSTTEDEQPIAAAAPDLARAPFFLLPASERKLTRQANALSRNGSYQVLFHETWRQPIGGARNAPSIFIHGGSTYGQHTELEGSITFSLPQLLQINTRLWLTRFEPNYGQEPGNWPTLPKTPAQLRAELAVETSEPDNLFGNNWLATPEPIAATSGMDATEPYLPQRIVLQEEERRIRQGELHYIDHPILGIVIQITPYEIPTADTAE